MSALRTGNDQTGLARDYDRRLREKSLLPGEAELRQRANFAELTAVALKQSPRLAKTLTTALRGPVGSNEPRYPAWIQGGTGTLPAGTPLFAVDGNSRPPLPASVTVDHEVFMGVTVRQNEDAENPFQVFRIGTKDRKRWPVKKRAAEQLADSALGDEGSHLVGM